MRYKTRIFQLLALLLVTVTAWSLTLAIPPDEDDVTVIGYEGAPACELYDGIILMSNESSEWDYKVVVWATARNDKHGNVSCGDVECTDFVCECSLSTVKVADADDFEVPKKACGFSDCFDECGPICDNTCVPPHVPPDHCTCVEGTYSVIEYRLSPSGDWFSMGEFIATLDITEKDQNSECPEGDRCD